VVNLFQALTFHFCVLYKTVFLPYVFVTFFAGEGKNTRQKHYFVFILIPGLKPRAMDIFLLWRNGNFAIF